MFDLEQSIAEWRKKMLAAGIKSPVPLEELEVHLREEIEAQVHSGKNEQQAFEATVLHIGQGQELQTEFSKEWEWPDILLRNMSIREKMVLFVWIAFCVLEFAGVYEKHIHSSAPLLVYALLIISSAIIAIAAYMGSIFWRVFLLNTTKRIRSIIEVIVTLGSFLILIPMILSVTRPSSHFREWMHILYVPFYFNVLTGVFLTHISLRLRLPTEPKKAAN
jgi:hypothetical protein